MKQALKERSKQLSDEVRDLPKELQRVREGEQSKSSCTESEDHPQKSACGSLEDVSEKTIQGLRNLKNNCRRARKMRCAIRMRKACSPASSLIKTNSA